MFVVELHRQAVHVGPGLVFSALIPDYHYFKGSEGGRTFPLLQPDGSSSFATGLTTALRSLLSIDVLASDVLAYVVGVTAHPGFTQTVADELTTPGIRAPTSRPPP